MSTRFLPLFLVAALAPVACEREPVIVIHFEAQDLAAKAQPIRLPATSTQTATPPAIPSATPPAKQIPTTPVCGSDGDCLMVKADCCGCRAGGKATSVARNQERAWEASLSQRCTETMCTQSLSTDASCKKMAACREGRCVLVDGKPTSDDGVAPEKSGQPATW